MMPQGFQRIGPAAPVRTLEQVALEWYIRSGQKLCHSRVQQIEKNALRKLRRLLAVDPMVKEYER